MKTTFVAVIALAAVSCRAAPVDVKIISEGTRTKEWPDPPPRRFGILSVSERASNIPHAEASCLYALRTHVMASGFDSVERAQLEQVLKEVNVHQLETLGKLANSKLGITALILYDLHASQEEIRLPYGLGSDGMMTDVRVMARVVFVADGNPRVISLARAEAKGKGVTLDEVFGSLTSKLELK